MREEELDILVGKLSELVTEDIVDAHMVGVTADVEHKYVSLISLSKSLMVLLLLPPPLPFLPFLPFPPSLQIPIVNLREVRDRKKWVRIEHIGLEKSLKQVPRHYVRGRAKLDNWKGKWRFFIQDLLSSQGSRKVYVPIDSWSGTGWRRI